jgi:DNA polymerase I
MRSEKFIITKRSQLKKLIRHCKQTGYCCFDFETTGLEYYKEENYPTVLSVSFQPGSSWVIPLGHFDSPFKDHYEEILKEFGKAVLENINITKIAWNLSFELKWCYRYNIFPKGRLFDAMLAKYLLDETRPNDLKSMVTRFLPEFSQYENEIENLVKKHGWAGVPLEELCTYAALDSDLEFRLYLMFEKRLIEKGLYTLFRNLLMMAVRVLSESEYRGFRINKARLLELKKEYQVKIDDCEDKLRYNPRFYKYEQNRLKRVKKDYIKSLKEEMESLDPDSRPYKNRESKISMISLGNFTTQKEVEMMAPFNFGSPHQLKDLLFLSKKGFGFDIVKYTEDEYGNETDNPSTAEDVLLELKKIDKSGFINQLLEYRGLLHIRNNFIDGFIKKEHEERLHGSYLLHGTVSGRLSSRGPNMQQIPRITTNPDIKPLFIPSPGKVIMQVDYSQAELRVMAAMAQEKEMLRWFKEGRDIHLASACKKHNFDYDKAKAILKDIEHPDNTLWVKQRKQAKTINFGIIYGQHANHLSESLSTDDYRVTKEEAQLFLDDFFRDFPRVRNFINKQHRLAKTNGYVVSPFGRKRRLPEIESINWSKKAEAQRQSVNAVIQGCASDYTQFSSILIWEEIQKGNLPISLKQLATVHDSLIYECYPEDIHKVIPIMRAICEDPQTKQWFGFKLRGITMAVDFEIGNNWGSLSNYEIDKDYSSLVN